MADDKSRVTYGRIHALARSELSDRGASIAAAARTTDAGATTTTRRLTVAASTRCF